MVYDSKKNDWRRDKGGGRRIAVDSDGSPWLINSEDAIYRRDKNENWYPVEGKAFDIAGGPSGIWIITTQPTAEGANDFVPAVYDKAKKTWRHDTGGGVKIAVAPDGSPWLINSEKKIYKRGKDEKWYPVEGAAEEIAGRAKVPAVLPPPREPRWRFQVVYVNGRWQVIVVYE